MLLFSSWAGVPVSEDSGVWLLDVGVPESVEEAPDEAPVSLGVALSETEVEVEVAVSVTLPVSEEVPVSGAVPLSVVGVFVPPSEDVLVEVSVAGAFGLKMWGFSEGTWVVQRQFAT